MSTEKQVQAKSREAFEKAHPSRPFIEAEFTDWQRAQIDPELAVPTWRLKEISGTSTEADFQVWRSGVVTARRKDFEKFKEETGLTGLSFEEHERLCFEHEEVSGSVDTGARWILQHAYGQAKTSPVSPTQDDFPTFVRRLKFKHDFPAQTTEGAFRRWNAEQDQELHQRHLGSHLPLSFEKWKAQQDSGIMIDPAPFVRLGKKERKAYRTTCQSGILARNGFPLDTAFDKTLHSGSGYAIFVIGSDNDLYCGSHIGGVFHHSSFLSDAATVAAGEIKTNPDGSIAKISSKSGHYRPTDAQNLYMLRYFRDRGVNLASVEFTFFGPTGATERRNALAYLDELEYKQGLGILNVIDPTLFP